MLEALLEWDEELFLLLNSLNSAACDQVMWVISNKFTWVPFYLALLIWIFYQYRWQGIFRVIAIVLVITFADQVTSGFMKPYFQRPRPCHEEAIAGEVHLVSNKCGGQYGFASSHAANSVGLAAILILLFKPGRIYLALLVFWAVVVSYSRVYLGVHYPGDILFGGGIGVLGAWLVYVVYRKIPGRYL